MCKPEASPLRDAGRYRSSGSPRWIAFFVVAAIHGALFCALTLLGSTVPQRHQAPVLIVDLIPLAAPPSPAPPEKRELPVRRMKPAPIHIAAPSPIIPVPAMRPTVAMRATPPPPAPADNTPPSTPSGPITVNNLAVRLISATPPRYPLESRRKREVGTVALLVLVGEDGRVEDISISQSSGFERLDRAALDAVQRWRWSPTMINGQAVRVRGLVRIPVELRL